MESRYCIECEDVFLGDWTEVLCPSCRGENDSYGDYTASRNASKAKRANNRKRGPEILTEHGIAFESKNDGAHLIVRHNGHTVDYWPGTGKFIFREGGQGRGVFRMLKLLNAGEVK